MSFKKAIFFIIVLMSSCQLLAEEVVPKGIGCDAESGDCFIILTSNFQNTSCSKKDQIRMRNDKNGTPGQYSAALAALMAGKKLEVGSVACWENYPTPSYLYVIN